MVSLKRNYVRQHGWKRRLEAVGRSLIDNSIEASNQASAPELITGAQTLVGLLAGKQSYVSERLEGNRFLRYLSPTLGGKLPLWESRVNQSRSAAFELIDYLASPTLGGKVSPFVQARIQKDITNLMALGREQQSKEHERTNVGRFSSYDERISASYRPERFQNSQETAEELKSSLLKLSQILKGNARDSSGKLIWTWKSRLEEAEKVLSSLESDSKRIYSSGNLNANSLKQVYFDAKEIFNIGIVGNRYLMNKYSGKDSKIDVYSPFRKLETPWSFSEKPIELSLSEGRSYSPAVFPSLNFFQRTYTSIENSLSGIKSLAHSLSSKFAGMF